MPASRTMTLTLSERVISVLSDMTRQPLLSSPYFSTLFNMLGNYPICLCNTDSTGEPREVAKIHKEGPQPTDGLHLSFLLENLYTEQRRTSYRITLLLLTNLTSNQRAKELTETQEPQAMTDEKKRASLARHHIYKRRLTNRCHA
jgi:hypothetical protein